jgi:hypothetical protein
VIASISFRPVLIVLGMAAALLLPAFWNRYPLLYYDSLDYVTMPYIWKMPVYRTGGYGVFGLTGRLAGSVWGIAVAQALMVAYVIWETFRTLAPDLKGRIALVVFAGLLVLTSLPWVTSEIMPDAFTGAVVLAVLVLGLREDMLGPWRRAALVAIIAVGGAAHPTHIALTLGLILCLIAIDLLARLGLPLMRTRVRFVTLGVVLGLAFLTWSNWAMTGRVFLGPRTTASLTMAVLIEDGVAKRYLAEVCPSDAPRKPILCPYRDQLPNDANDFLWHTQAFWDLDGWAGFEDEAPWMVGEIIKRYPGAFLMSAARLSARQFVTLRTGEGFEPMQQFMGEGMRIFWWWEMPAFLNARQQSQPTGQLLPLDPVNAIHVPAALVAFAALLVLAVMAWRRRDATTTTVAILILLTYLGNAVLCGAVSNPADRYGARIAWVVVLGALSVGVTTLRARRLS